MRIKKLAEALPLLREPRALRSGWLTQALLVFEKDMRIEIKTGEITTTAGFFAILIAVCASFAFAVGEGKTTVAPGVIWISVAFASVLILGRSWYREREESALLGLLVSPLSRSAIFAGKTLGVMCFLLIVELLVIPVTALLFALDLTQLGLGLTVITLVATPGIAASGTLFGAMIVRTRARDLVLGTVLLPLITPMLLAAIVATRELVGGAALDEITDSLWLMAVFDFVFLTGGLALFGILIEE